MKKLLFILLAVITLSSCNKEYITYGTCPPKVIKVGFNLDIEKEVVNFAATNENAIKAALQATHNYATTGYVVEFYGNNLEETIIYNDVNLATDNFTLEVVGDININVYHPDYSVDSITTVAYYGIEEILPTSTQDEVIVNVDLIQSFIAINAKGLANRLIDDISFNGVGGYSLDTYYYMSKNIDILIDTKYRDQLTVKNVFVKGKGTQYTIIPFQSGVRFELPEYEAPSNGTWD